MMRAPTADELNADEVAELCGVSRATVARWAKTGHLKPIDPYNPYRRRQLPYRFRRADVERLKEEAYQRAG